MNNLIIDTDSILFMNRDQGKANKYLYWVEYKKSDSGNSDEVLDILEDQKENV